jgi:hypothetical protein
MGRFRLFAVFLALLFLVAPALANVTYKGGKGTSTADAMIIKASDTIEGIAAERQYIKKQFPGWKPRTQSLLEEGMRHYDVIEICKASICKSVYFDITSFFGKWE